MDKTAIEALVRQITDDMYKQYGYVVEDMSFIEGVYLPWGISKKLIDGTQTTLIFMNLEYSTSFDEDFESEIAALINCRREKLIKVILIDEKMEQSEVQNKLNHFRSMHSAQNHFIVLDLMNREIQLSDKAAEPIANQIASCMGKNETKEQRERAKPIITYGMIGLNLLMFAVSVILSGSIMDIDTGVLVVLGAKYNPAIGAGQWFRLVTCMFLHGGLIHIATNMFSLYSIGPLVEQLYGKVKYIIMYLATGITASLFSFFFSPHVSIGASGAIFGLLGIVLVFAIKQRKTIGKGFVRNVASVVVINLLIGFSLPGIDNFGHLGGLVSGIGFGLVMKLSKKK